MGDLRRPRPGRNEAAVALLSIGEEKGKATRASSERHSCSRVWPELHRQLEGKT